MNRIVLIKKRLDEAYYEGYELADDIQYLLSKLEIAEQALNYYADLYKNLYQNIQEGELYQSWLERQGETAREALKQLHK